MLAPREKLWSAPAAVVDAALVALAPAAGETLIDIGCGDGRVVFAAVQRHGFARAVGIEAHEGRAAAAAAEVVRLGLADRAAIVHGNALELDVSRAWPAGAHLTTAIYLYLIDRGLRGVWPQVLAAAQALRDSGWARPLRIVTVLYPLPSACAGAELRARHVVRMPGPAGVELQTPIHLYEVLPPSHGDGGGACATDAAAAGGAGATGSAAIGGATAGGAAAAAAADGAR